MEEFINRLRENKIFLSLKGEDLKISFDGTEVPAEILAELKLNKSALIEKLRRNGIKSVFKSIEAISDRECYELSSAQKRLWVLSQFSGSSEAYNLPAVVKLKGSYNIENFKKAINSIVNRHEILRTVFKERENGEVKQWILSPQELNFEMDYRDFRGHPNDLELAERFISEDSFKPFDLVNGPLFRTCLLHLSDNSYLFYYNMHHIISDGWSKQILERDVLAYYSVYNNGNFLELPELKIQYKDYASWQLELLNSDLWKKHQHYWLEILSGKLPLIDLPSSKVRPSVLTQNGSKLKTYLSAESCTQLKSFCQSHGGSLFMGLFAVWNVLCYKYTSESDLITGTPVAGRDHVDLENQIGFYVNTLALRVKLSPIESFEDLFKQIKDTTISGYSHQMYQFDQLVEDLELKRDASRSPIFDVIFTLQNFSHSTELFQLDADLIDQFQYEESTASMFDVDINFEEKGQYISFDVNFNTDVYEKEIIEGLMIHYKELLKQLLLTPQKPIGKVTYLSEKEEYQLLSDFNDRSIDFPKDKTIVDLFHEQVLKTPNNLAISFENQKLTYLELDLKSNDLAHYLIQKYEIKVGDLVSVELESSNWLVIVIIAVLKTGGAYVPLDLNSPISRNAQIKKDCESVLCIDTKVIEEFEKKKQLPFERITVEIPTETNAYVIYTSGSAGKPKGVSITHSNLVNKLFEEHHILNIVKPISYGITNCIFDVSILEIIYPLLFGGTVVIPRKSKIMDFNAFIDDLITHQVSILQGTPTYLSEFISYLNDSKGAVLNQTLSTICIGGESLNRELVSKVKELLPNVRINNHYGPTEVTIDAIVNVDIESFDSNNIGSPMANTKVFILDKQEQLVPVNVYGEITISGPSVAVGYLNQSQFTKEKFVSNPHLENVKMYKTGDLGRWLPDGTIEFAGRIDDQVKIRGYRIELAEIEAVMNQHKSVKNSVVVTSGSEENKLLHAYIISNHIERTHFWPSVGEYPLYDAFLYYSMTNDINRNDKYKSAINSLVNGKTVVDIGTGKDAILSRFCIDGGAKKVYSIEMDITAYEAAKKTISELDLEDKIHLIFGNAVDVELPELVDVCISEIIGNIGGAEGASVILNEARRFLKADGIMIPDRCNTRIAAVCLPEVLNKTPYFDSIGASYTDKIFEEVGHEFDVRLCLKDLSSSQIISTNEIIEDLKFNEHNESEFIKEFSLVIEKSSRFDGLLLWINLFTSSEDKIDSLEKQTNWMPVYFPLFSSDVNVSEGDFIEGQFISKLSDNKVNPDYLVKGNLIYKNGKVLPFKFDSFYTSKPEVQNPLYAKLFENKNTGLLFRNNEFEVIESLKSHLKEQLPSYMIPNDFRLINELPLTSNGKLDKNALPKLDEFKGEVDYVPPSDEVEEKLVEIWEEILGRKRIGINDNFFELGGNSLKITQLISKISKEFNVKINHLKLFNNATIKGVKEEVETIYWANNDLLSIENNRDIENFSL